MEVQDHAPCIIAGIISAIIQIFMRASMCLYYMSSVSLGEISRILFSLSALT